MSFQQISFHKRKSLFIKTPFPKKKKKKKKKKTKKKLISLDFFFPLSFQQISFIK